MAGPGVNNYYFSASWMKRSHNSVSTHRELGSNNVKDTMNYC